jgi:MFS family permease
MAAHSAALSTRDHRRCGGNVIEWYDFYIFGSLAAVLSVKFFEKSNPVAALLSTIALFTAGFLVRPLGAFLFGWLGDRVGRKYTFLITLSGMALGTGAIGLIPTFDQIGVAAAIILFCLRMLQGLCLGGQYGGAITYVAEHVSDERRGYYTGWLQTSPTLGIVLSLVVIIAVRTSFGDATFNDWAWRMRFLFSFLLVLIAYYVRVNFHYAFSPTGYVFNPWDAARPSYLLNQGPQLPSLGALARVHPTYAEAGYAFPNEYPYVVSYGSGAATATVRSVMRRRIADGTAPGAPIVLPEGA